MELVKDAQLIYDDVMQNKSDPRVQDWPLMDSMFPTLTVSVAYVYFVKVMGPSLMKDRPAFKLNKVLIFYNLLQAIFSMYLFYEFSANAWLNGYSWRCEPVDYSNSPVAVKIASLCWWYFASKFTEFLDTIFFVMRKRYDQISNLHVIHHSTMPICSWFVVKFIPGGQSTFYCFLNSFVHIVMYTYYMLAAMGPEMQKYLWWKKHLTLLQMIQFMVVIVHILQLVISNDCNYPMIILYGQVQLAVVFIFLFLGFYIKTYETKSKKLAQS